MHILYMDPWFVVQAMDWPRNPGIARAQSMHPDNPGIALRKALIDMSACNIFY